MTDPIYAGLISGTSMDGVDCALITTAGDDITLLDFTSHPIPHELRDRILALCRKDRISTVDLGRLDVELGRIFAAVIKDMLHRRELDASDITAIGSHGQTIWHQPRSSNRDTSVPFTLQIADPNTICQLTGITTVADFRRKDMAAGGQGAPLVPAFHRAFFRKQDCDRVVINIGGMSNITVLGRDKALPVAGFDTGPGNVLMDCWTQKVLGKPFDDNGQWAATGQCDGDLLKHFLDEPYFTMPAPKSTGRELFNADWLTEKLLSFRRELRPENVQATLLSLTASSLAATITQFLDAGELIVCGGGASNSSLLQALTRNMPDFQVLTSSECGIHPDAVEATAFAWMASKTLAREPIDFTSITGASEPGIAGGIYFYN